MTEPGINFVTFSQDQKRLAVGTTKGLRLQQIEGTPVDKSSLQADEGNVSIVETMYRSSLVAFVLSPRRLILKDIRRESTIHEFTYPSAILAVRMNRERLVVVCEEEMFVYNLSDLNLIYTIATSPNPNALCALSSDLQNWQYLAYPLPKAQEEASSRPSHAPPSSKFVAPTSGEVLIFDVKSLKNLNVIEAHRAPLSCIAFSARGTLLATSSETGTIIRVFSVPGGQKLYQFRRGTYPSTIYNMSFDYQSEKPLFAPDASSSAPVVANTEEALESRYLAVSSTTDTIHIFKLGLANTCSSGESSPQTASSRLSRTISNNRDNSESPPLENETQRPPPERKPRGTLGSMFRRTSQMMSKNVAGVVGSYLPQSMTEMFEPARDFAFIKMKSEGAGDKDVLGTHVRTIVGFQEIEEEKPTTLVYVVTSNGDIHKHTLDLRNGGECMEIF